MGIRSMLRWLFTLLFVVLLLPNIEKLVEQRGWNRFLSDNWESIMSDIASNPWYIFVLGFVLGCVVLLWVDFILRKLKVKIIYPNIQTSVKAQFKAGSNDVLQLSSKNNSNTLFERALFNFHGDNDKLLAQHVLWYVFITFEKPTTYGQIIVDAGNAKIPNYQVISAKDDSAILRFDGDIGNVAIEIKTLSAKNE